MRRRHGKFNAQRTYCDGILFASKHEARVYQELRLRELAGEIGMVALQTRYPLAAPNGQVVAYYVADFDYMENGRHVTADAKGMRTPVYRLKAKWFAAQYGRTILEL